MSDADDVGSQDEDVMPPPLPPQPQTSNGMPPGLSPAGADTDEQPPLPAEPEIIHLQLHKVKGSMGLSIVAAKVSLMLD